MNFEQVADDAERQSVPAQKRQTAVLIMGILVAGVTLAACGRSAPEGAAPIDPGAAEPTAAGVQVVSEQQVIVPPPTTATIPTTVTTTAQPAAQAGTYVVMPGDTLSAIAAQFGISTEALSQANEITDVNSIRPGQELIIPAAG